MGGMLSYFVETRKECAEISEETGGTKEERRV
jgi:hypothetical protein